MTGVHPTAARGFVRPDVYERGRPGYPTATVDALGISAGELVLDLGCGTGKFTRLLASSDARVLGIEPLAGMLQAFRRGVPGVPAVAAVAEAIPVRSAVAQVVVCASAFHWFDHDRALPEVHRVLRPGGRLGIVWNRRDELTGWPAEFWRITESHRGDTPGYRTGAWRDALERSPLFGPIAERRFEHSQHTDAEGLIARVASISFIETLPPSTREAVLDEARTFLSTHPETRGRSNLELPYRTVVYTSERVS